MGGEVKPAWDGLQTAAQSLLIARMNKKERGYMITIEKLVDILKEDLTRVKKYVNKDVYDGDGIRDIFQEGYNYGHEVTVEEILKLIDRGDRIK